jgi:F-type H+-transporting ATPase subunit b
MFANETFWVAVAFVLFAGLMIYYRVPGKLAAILDERAARIRNELEQAQRLRHEAQTLLNENQRRQRNALKEAEEIVARAEIDAQRMTKAAEAEFKAQMTRRAALAKAKIAQAEAAAIKEVRAAIVDVAIAATRDVLRAELTGPEAFAAADRAISELRSGLKAKPPAPAS